jgi:ribosomal protein S18 acetylase RimI-like enzyme
VPKLSRQSHNITAAANIRRKEVLSPDVGIEIRRAVETDAAFLSYLRASFFADQFDKGSADSRRNAPARLLSETAKLIKRRRTVVLVAIRNGLFAGYIVGQTRILPEDASPVAASIEELFVLKRARRCHLARELVRTLMSEFRLAGVQKTELRVLDLNDEGKAFWEQAGFFPSYSVYEHTAG